MRRKPAFIFLSHLVAAFFVCLSLQAQTNLSSLVRDRYCAWMFAVSPGESLQSIRMPGAGGRWADINYADNQAGKWNPAEHLRRTRQMAMAWAKPGGRHFHDAAMLSTIEAALNDWLLHRYQSSNWWHNEIGVPQYMRDILFLLGRSLSPRVYDGAMSVFHQFKVNGTGANLVWSADLGLHYAILTGDTALVKFCADTLQSAVQVRTEEGVQPDFSFHQHGARLQQYQYGRAFLVDNLRLAYELQSTPFAYPAEKITILSHFLLEGWQWMARGINTVPGTMDRSASRVDALRSADLRSVIPFLVQLDPANAKSLRSLQRIQNGDSSLLGYRYFPRSDFAAMHTRKFSFFLKTNSTRTLLTESINGENLQGGLLDNGDAYLIRDGNEYFNLMPCWNWQYLPGITSFPGAGREDIRRKDFTGDVSDGQSGMAVMQQELGKDGGEWIRLRKTWISHRNTTIVLLGGMQLSGLKQPAFTVMDQCRSRGAVECSNSACNASDSVHSFPQLGWMYQHGFAYLPLYDDSVVIKNGPRTGRWTDINKSESPALVTDSVFLPFLVHRNTDTVSGYAVVACESAADAKKISGSRPWKILSNTRDCQSVCFDDGSVAIAFYQAGQYVLKGIGRVAVDHSCLLWRNKSKHWYASDPLHRGGLLHCKVGKTKGQVEMPHDGTTVAMEMLRGGR